MADERKKNRSVEPTAMEWSRYLVQDKCLRDQHRYYHMEEPGEGRERDAGAVL